MQVPWSFVGVDVSKAELAISTHGQDACTSVPNEHTPILDWLRTLPPNSLLAMESTGRYHQRLAELATAMGLRVFVLNARDVYFYAKALGARGKTDRTDAQLIARYLAEHHARLHPYQLPSASEAQLQQLLGQRWTVVTKRTALRESLKTSDPSITEAIGALDDSFASLLHAIDQRITALIKADDSLQRTRALLQSIVGIGPQSSALLAGLLTRLTFANSDALVAYSGLDPRPNDSGRHRGRRRLSKRGSPALRHQMFMAAMSACHTKTFAPTYWALRDRGLKTTEALVILARKLLRIVFAVWRSGQPFDPHRFTSGA
jgi:transposase